MSFRLALAAAMASLTAKQPKAGAPSLAPDPLLLVFQSLGAKESLRYATPVCKRWAHLATAPEVVRTLDVTLSGMYALRRAEALHRWLERRGAGAVQELTVRVQPWYHRDRSTGGERAVGGVGVTTVFLSTDEAKDILVQLLLGVTACGRSGALSRLTLLLESLPNFHVPWSVVTALRRVRHLHLSCTQTRVTLAVPLSPMSAMRRLCLEAAPLRVQSGSSLGLPAALTSLRLGGLGEGGLPQQVTSLTRLRSLHLAGMASGHKGYTVLPRLAASLGRLALRSVHSLPPPDAVAALTRLTALHLLESIKAGTVGAAGALLAAAAGLKELRISHSGPTKAQLLPAVGLAGLTRLQNFCWEVAEGAAAGKGGDEGIALPGGAWLAGLQRLHAAPSVLLASLEALEAAAGQLHTVAVPHLDPSNTDHQDLVRRLAIGLPSIRHISTDAPAAGLAGEGFAAALAEARQARPDLSVDSLPAEELPFVVLSPEDDDEEA